MIFNQSTGCTMPPITSKPAGVCNQLLDERIQNVETSVPNATMQLEKEMQALGDAPPAEQHHAQETGFEKKTQ